MKIDYFLSATFKPPGYFAACPTINIVLINSAFAGCTKATAERFNATSDYTAKMRYISVDSGNIPK